MTINTTRGKPTYVWGNYTAFYKVDGDEVHIIRVLLGRRNFMQILFGKSYDE
jgi:hypothetical protein